MAFDYRRKLEQQQKKASKTKVVLDTNLEKWKDDIIKHRTVVILFLWLSHYACQSIDHFISLSLSYSSVFSMSVFCAHSHSICLHLSICQSISLLSYSSLFFSLPLSSSFVVVLSFFFLFILVGILPREWRMCFTWSSLNLRPMVMIYCQSA